MQTLSYGYQKPQTGDLGPVLFPAMENNIQRLNDHNHDGSNSAQLTRTAVASSTQTLSSASWSATSNGNYRQSVTMPAGFDFDTISMQFRLSTGQQIHPTIERISDTSFYVYINDNSVDVIVLYG